MFVVADFTVWQDSINGDEVVTSTLMFQGRRELQEKLLTAQSAAAVAAELTVTSQAVHGWFKY